MGEIKKPLYLLAGRCKEEPDPFIRMVLRDNSSPFPSIAYVGAANDDRADFLALMTRACRGAGAGRIDHVLLAPEKADLNRARDILQSSDIVFIGGGDVDRGMRALEEKGMDRFLSDLYERGKPFFGVSAGSIMLAKAWVRWRDPENDESAELFPCLGLAPLICDTHDEDAGWQELKTALNLERGTVKGYGIVSGTAIKVYPDGRVEALGGAVHPFLRVAGKVQKLSDLLPVH